MDTAQHRLGHVFLLQKTVSRYLKPATVFLLVLLLIKLLATLGTLFVYAKVTPLNDAQLYLNQPPVPWNMSVLLQRTVFTEHVFGLLKSLLHYDFLVHCFVSVVLGLVLWCVVKPEYEYLNKKLLYTCLCLPHFLIWTGIVGKEALAISAFLLIIRACVDLVVWRNVRVVLLLVGLFLACIERAHYAIAYVYLLLVSLLFMKINHATSCSYSSVKKSFALLIATSVSLLVLVVLLQPLYAHYVSHFMTTNAYDFFLIHSDANTNRTTISWSESTDFFTNLTWGIPISIVGPTLFEALKRVVLVPVFIEGCVALFLLGVMCWMLFRTCKNNPKYGILIIWGFFPAVMLGLLIHYPFGIFNVGSAIRYKQSLAPLFYFYPILLMGAIAKQRHYNYSCVAC